MPAVPAHDWTPLRIRELRVRLGKTQTELADILTKRTGRKVWRTRVAAWEGGFSRPMLSWLPLLNDLDRAAPPMRGPVVDYRRVLHD